MKLPGWPDKQPEQVERTLKAWVETPAGRPRLVVLDNLEDVAVMQEWLAWLDQQAGEAVRLLVTAQRRDWPDGLRLSVRPLGEFSLDESRDFLRQYLDEQRAGDGIWTRWRSGWVACLWR